MILSTTYAVVTILFGASRRRQEEEEAEEKGRIAFTLNMKLSDNPYRTYDWNRRDRWVLGYNKAERNNSIIVSMAIEERRNFFKERRTYAHWLYELTHIKERKFSVRIEEEKLRLSMVTKK